MSQPRSNHEYNMYVPYYKQKVNKGKNSENVKFRKGYKDTHYYSTKYNYYHPQWSQRRRKPALRSSQRLQQRPPSPFSGTEEYTQRKIQQTSDMIKQRLMMPPELDNEPSLPENTPVNEYENITKPNDISTIKNNKNESERKTMKKSTQYNVGEIHDQILTHITKLSHGKKMNLIHAKSSGYDVAIQQIQKQKRLELSKALRDMCSNQSTENSEVLNAIIPDFNIKIETLPLEIIQELSDTLDLTFNEDLSPKHNVKNNVSKECYNDDDDDVIYVEPKPVKQEIIEVADDDVKCEAIDIGNELGDEVTEDRSSCTPDLNFDSGDCMDTDNFDFSQQIKHERNEIYSISSSDITSSLNTDVSVENNVRSTVCNAVQTELFVNTISTQTDNTTPLCPFAMKANIVENNLNDALKVMFEIDEEISRLTRVRQSLLTKFQTHKNSSNNSQQNNLRAITKKTPKTQKIKNIQTGSLNDSNKKTRSNVNNIESNNLSGNKVAERNDFYHQPLKFKSISEKILVIKFIECDNNLLAATEQGTIYCISIKTGKTVHVLKTGQTPITTICHLTFKKKTHILVGFAQNPNMHEYNSKRRLIRITHIGEDVQCLEKAWLSTFIGTSSGSLMRYSINLSRIEFKEKISRDSILVLKATLEGARRVLLVGTRNAPVCVRDAMSGLHLRTMNDFITPTVYSLVLENSMVYCGTTVHDILVFSFHDGNLVTKYAAANSKGISCIKVVRNLLFASCYNGNIYVYNIKTHQHVGVIEGPGGVIISMEILKNIVILGTLSCQFVSILIPNHMLEYNII